MADIRILSRLIIGPVTFNDGIKMNANKYSKFIDNMFIKWFFEKMVAISTQGNSPSFSNGNMLLLLKDDACEYRNIK